MSRPGKLFCLNLKLNFRFIFFYFQISFFYFPALLEFFFAKSTAPMVLQIIYVNGATVRTGVEIEGSVVVRMLKYGDVVESFQRLKTKEGASQMFIFNFCRLVLGRERAFFFITLTLILTLAGTLTETIPLILYSTGILRYQIADGWISGKLRGGNEDSVLTVLRKLIPNGRSLQYEIIREGKVLYCVVRTGYSLVKSPSPPRLSLSLSPSLLTSPSFFFSPRWC